MDDLGGTLIGMEPGTADLGSVTSMESTVTAPAESTRGALGRDGACEDVNLGFLTPSNRAGSLGKIDSYDVYGVLGLGGMGIVLKAVDKALSRTVAVKVQKPLLALDSRSRGRFLKEARAVAAINHPNVVTIHTVNVVRGRPYLVMEYIAGGSLRQRIKSGIPLPTCDVLRIGLQVAEGLAAAHERGLIHRDIKPANILLEGPNLLVKITDFGLAVTNPGEAALASAGRIVGTPAYMSPEQIRGDLLDARSDLFSLGGVLHAMILGHSPFAAPTPKEAVDRVRNHDPVPLAIARPDCPAAISDLVAKLLRKDPQERPGSAQEVAARLREVLAEVERAASSDEVADEPEPAVTEPTPRKSWRLLGFSARGLACRGRRVRRCHEMGTSQPPGGDRLAGLAGLLSQPGRGGEAMPIRATRSA